MPIYASEITINLIRGFISVDEKLLNILVLNKTQQIDGVLVTAIDANHCPGAIMILFQLPCGKRILHTGDFRWSPKMEIDLSHQTQKIELVYLDTTHISDKHIIGSQEECITKAIHCIRELKKCNKNKKILFVVCTDLIGKENFWWSIAQAFDLKVWSDGKRKKAMSIIGNKEILKKIVSNANEADLHVLSHAVAGYKQLDEYFRKFSDTFDMVLSIKPKGSESLNPEFGHEVNSISVRYSEHSTHKELRRFLGFLLPTRVISTVPLGTNIFRCPKIPVSWHTKELYVPYKKQASLLNYVRIKERPRLRNTFRV
ncbi:DNA cross-link repair 1A protein-like [Episyrphus balteatus]|uniref:DNA cross-link repair 1A protein-like n=1 Tax=Episyrphus balteatus TaxID=286459 RepID=UPI0024852799|nr:DNA cross-link repair 1A protein-like [Episyrphus balteatus]XP_055858414.1 DNA cross-link repair 1A protein-like [Episyrphus balteatus]XP_055858415.1 DNA cross-link repair 1A protein-like [Episyrphus balteatus]XP_055858416.1 DNA cross-link repair 1A protein-like [Episyrphus balteatus]